MVKEKGNKQKKKCSGKLYCVCQQPYDGKSFMVSCVNCDEWFHGKCIGILEKQAPLVENIEWHCAVCRSELLSELQNAVGESLKLETENWNLITSQIKYFKERSSTLKDFNTALKETTSISTNVDSTSEIPCEEKKAEGEADETDSSSEIHRAEEAERDAVNITAINFEKEEKEVSASQATFALESSQKKEGEKPTKLKSLSLKKHAKKNKKNSSQNNEDEADFDFTPKTLKIVPLDWQIKIVSKTSFCFDVNLLLSMGQLFIVASLHFFI